MNKVLKEKRDELCYRKYCGDANKECLKEPPQHYIAGFNAASELWQVECEALELELNRLDRLIGRWPHNGPRIKEALTRINKFMEEK